MKWYCLKQIFAEKRKNAYTAFSIYILIKETTPQKAIRKALKLSPITSHPHGLKKVFWKYLGIECIIECFQPPQRNNMLFCYKANGSSWQDAVQLIKSPSTYDLFNVNWPKPMAPENLFIVELVYFIKSKSKPNIGKVTSVAIIIKAPNLLRLYQDAYQLAVLPNTKINVKKVRKDVQLNCPVEFVGISNIYPIYNKIKDGMELEYTVQKYHSLKEIDNLVTDPSSLIWKRYPNQKKFK